MELKVGDAAPASVISREFKNPCTPDRERFTVKVTCARTCTFTLSAPRMQQPWIEEPLRVQQFDNENAKNGSADPMLFQF